MNWTCAQCETENKRLYRFCFVCGAAAPQPSDAPGPAAPESPAAEESPRPKPEIAPEESGWRCHECWFKNLKSSETCAECGTRRRASARADVRDRAFGVFGAFGKWPLVVLFVLAVGGGLAWLYYYLNPKHGERIDAPAGLEAEIRASLDDVSTRQTESIVFYNCFSTNVGGRKETGGYAAFARLVPRSANVANRTNEPDPGSDRFWRFIAHRDGYKWRIERFGGTSQDPPSDPCSVDGR